MYDPLVTMEIPQSENHLYEYLPDPLLAERESLLSEGGEVLTERSSVDVLHHDVKLVLLPERLVVPITGKGVKWRSGDCIPGV